MNVKNADSKSIGRRMLRENIWRAFLKMWGQGFAPKGAKLNDKLPMNPEGDKGDEAQELSMGSIRIHT